MESGTAVWYKDKKSNDWIATIIQQKEYIDGGKVQISVQIEESGECISFFLDDEALETDNVKLCNDPSDSDVENLINLPYLHEPAILFCLETRYRKSDIYTYTGPILIAMNPFKAVPLYTSQILETYYNHGLLKSQGIDNSSTKLPPHIYAIADAAYRDMMRIIMGGFVSSNSNSGSGGSSTLRSQASAASANQAILVSGESGAGKTESTKIVLRYLTAVGNSSGGIELTSGSVMDKILQSNPILEAFGNARTLRNDNSSRFGKFIELNFNKRGQLIGGTIRTYLLEKVRLASQSLGERNFHIFYQLGVGAPQEEKEKWQFTEIQNYWYANQGEIFQLRHVDDRDEYLSLRKALCTLNFDSNSQTSLFDIIAGLLHLGQLQFVVDGGDGEGSEIARQESVMKSLQMAAQLLGIPLNQLSRTLTVRTISTRQDTYEKKLTPAQAAEARDALSKAIYGRLFDWIVLTINLSIQTDPTLVRADIGVLDIFGFECFKSNSFEQLCINYTNETLQQQFNQFVFKMEQCEYQKEKIEWSFIEFPDNQDCLDLIENKPNGILAMLDDECKLPKASDEKLASRMYKALEAHARFSATAPQRRDSMFCIRHYAGPVVYSAITFVEKNKDELPKEAASLMQTSSMQLMNLLFSENNVETKRLPTGTSNSASKSDGNKSTAPSVGTQFKEQLTVLMEKIYATAPHYIRCLKPNDENIPDSFHRQRTTEQLQYGGVLEAVRVARSGFPVRLNHNDFFARYRPLSNPFHPNTSKLPRVLGASVEPRIHCESLLSILLDEDSFSDPGRNTTVMSSRKLHEIQSWRGKGEIEKSSIQLGLSKVFLRKQAHDSLESRRSKRIGNAARIIQGKIRCHLFRLLFLQKCWALRLIQRVGRGFVARRRATVLRRNQSAVLIQKCFRSHHHYFRYFLFRQSIIILQSGCRARKAKKYAAALRYTRNSSRLQRILRGIFQRFKWRTFRRSLIFLQCGIRRRIAKKVFHNLRSQAKDIGRLQQSNENLKAEIELLRSRAAEETKRLQDKMAAELAEMAQVSASEKAAEILSELERERQLRIAAESKLAETEVKLEAAELSLLHYTTNASTKSVQGSPSPPLLSIPGTPDFISTPSSGRKISFRNEATSPIVAIQSNSKSPAGSRSNSRSNSLSSSSFSEELMALQNLLDSERSNKAVVDEEVSRLRHITMDLTAQIEILRRTGTSEVSGSGTKEENPRRRPSFLPSQQINIGRPGSDDSNNALKNLGQFDTSKVQRRVSNVQSRKDPWANAWDEDENGNDDKTSPAKDTKIDGDGDDKVEVIITTPTVLTDNPISISNNRVMINASSSSSSGSSNNNSSSNRGHFHTMGGNSNSNSNSSSSSSNNSSSSFSNRMGKSSIKGKVGGTHGDSKAAMGKFEKSVEMFKQKFQQGIKAVMWDGQRVTKVEVTIRLTSNNQILVFEQQTSSRRMFFSFANKEIPPIRIVDITECIAGAEIADVSSDQCLLTIVSKDEKGESRVVALKFSSKEEKSNMQIGIRNLISEVLFIQQSPTMNALKNLSDGGIPATSSSSSSSKVDVQAIHRPTRRMTVRDTVLTEARDASASASASTKSSSGHLVESNKPPHLSEPVVDDLQNLDSLAEAKKQLLAERSNYERLMMQMLMVTNDLNEREELLTASRAREADIKALLTAKERMYESDAMSRMQLGKRLEQVLMDKEEATEQVEMLKEQIENFKLALQSK